MNAEIFSFSYDSATARLGVSFRVAGKLEAVELLDKLEGFISSLVANVSRETPVAQAVQSADVAPVASNGASKPVEPRRYKVPSAVGEIEMIAHSSGLFTAQCGMLRCSENSEERAIAGVIEHVQKLLAKSSADGVQAARDLVSAEKKSEPAVLPLAAPAPEAPVNGAPKPTQPPPEIMTAQGMRQVLEWFVQHGVTNPDAVFEKCTEWKAVVPALARAGGDLKERVSRGLLLLAKPA